MKTFEKECAHKQFIKNCIKTLRHFRRAITDQKEVQRSQELIYDYFQFKSKQMNQTHDDELYIIGEPTQKIVNENNVGDDEENNAGPEDNGKGTHRSSR